MATNWYVDPAAGGTNAGTSWTNAWTSLASAITSGTSVVAGDTVYCRGTQVLTTAILVSLTTVAGNWVRVIGCNSAGVDDGTLFLLNGNSAAANCMDIRKGYIYFKNIGCYGATSDGWKATTALSRDNRLVNCTSYSNGGIGFSGGDGLADNWQFNSCKSYLNTSYGFNNCSYGDREGGLLYGCIAYSNGNHGFYEVYFGSMKYCLSYTNTGSGFAINAVNPFVLENCVAYGNTGTTPKGHGLYAQAALSILTIRNCKFVGNANYGMYCSAGASSYFGGNNLVVNNPGGALYQLTQIISGLPADVVTGTDDGMVSSATGNFTEKTPIAGKLINYPLNALTSAFILSGVPPNPDFSAASSTRAPDTTDGVLGTQTAQATDADFLALEATRNISAGAGNILTGAHEHIAGVQIDGTLVALAVPAAPTISNIKNIGPRTAIVTITPEARTESLKIYANGVLKASGIQTFDYTLTGLLPNTVYAITAKGTNITGDSALSDSLSFTTSAASGDTADVALLSSTTVAVVTVTGAPKIVGSGTVKIFDPRVIGNAVSADAADYYWKDINENAGKAVLPMG